jgi:predicted AAA+ superfamily ATPase
MDEPPAIERRIKSRIRAALNRFPAVAILGPRQVGKTTLALSLAEETGEQAVYLDLELPSDRAKLTDPEIYLSEHDGHLVIMDEIHRIPGIFQTLRSIIDRRRKKAKRNGQFLLLGSASIDLLNQSAETLAGRIAYEELTPFSATETAAVAPLSQLWVRGGFPDSFLAANDADSFAWRTAFIRTYLERDVPALGPRIPAETLRRYWQMLAHNQSQLLNAAQLATSLGVSGQTVARYLDIMVDLLLVRRLQPWAVNTKKRLVKTPKVYIRDSGLVHALLGIRDEEELLGHPVAGASWEGVLIENILDALPSTARANFYRTSAGAEIDLVIEFSPKQRWAIEIKRSVSDPSPSKGFYFGSEDIRATRQIVLYPGKETYRLNAKTEVMPLDRLLSNLPA